MKRLVVLTRPEGQGDEVANRIAALGLAVKSLPVFQVAPAADPAALARQLATLGDYDLAVFVSPNAVQEVAAHLPSSWPTQVAIGVMGPASLTAVERAGWGARVIAPADRYDSEALYERLVALQQPRARVMILRGNGGRDWLAERLRSDGATVTLVESYRRLAQPLQDALRSVRNSAPTGSSLLGSSLVLVLTSSEAARHLMAEAEQAGCADWLREAQVLATHARIAETAVLLGFRDVKGIEPGDAGILRAVESLRHA